MTGFEARTLATTVNPGPSQALKKHSRRNGGIPVLIVCRMPVSHQREKDVIAADESSNIEASFRKLLQCSFVRDYEHRRKAVVLQRSPRDDNAKVVNGLLHSSPRHHSWQLPRTTGRPNIPKTHNGRTQSHDFLLCKRPPFAHRSPATPRLEFPIPCNQFA